MFQNITDLVFGIHQRNSKQIVLIGAPNEDFSLACHGIALLVASVDLADLVRVQSALNSRRLEHLHHWFGFWLSMLVPGIQYNVRLGALTEFVVAPGVHIAFFVKGEHVISASCNLDEDGPATFVRHRDLVQSAG